MNIRSNDNELVSRLQKGEAEAFDQLYKKYSWKLYRLTLKYLRSEADAEELVQTVFLKIWLNHKGLKKELSFTSYIFTIAYNDICKTFRKRHYQREFIEYARNHSSNTSAETEEPGTYQKVLDKVLEMIQDLPEKQKTIFIKSRFEGKSTKAIAAEMSLSPGTVDNYISKVLKFLKDSIKR